MKKKNGGKTLSFYACKFSNEGERADVDMKLYDDLSTVLDTYEKSVYKKAEEGLRTASEEVAEPLHTVSDEEIGFTDPKADDTAVDPEADDDGDWNDDV